MFKLRFDPVAGPYIEDASPVAINWTWDSTHSPVLRLALASKGGAKASSGYHPLSIVNKAGKLSGKLIKPRLADPIRAAGDFSPEQYGFKAGNPKLL